MAKVSLTINGRKYALGCDDGEEARLERLGHQLDERVTLLANQFGQIGDVRLLVMAGITLMDELDDAGGLAAKKAEELAADVRKASEDAIDEARMGQAMATDSLLEAAKRIENLAALLAPNKS
jgi:cell division protein ZapA